MAAECFIILLIGKEERPEVYPAASAYVQYSGWAAVLGCLHKTCDCSWFPLEFTPSTLKFSSQIRNA